MNRSILFFLSLVLLLSCSDDAGNGAEAPSFQLSVARVGTYTLNLTNQASNTEAPYNQGIVVTFSVPLDRNTVEDAVTLRDAANNEVPLTFAFLDNDKTFSATVALTPNANYSIVISDVLRGTAGERFPGFTITFKTIAEPLTITSMKFDNVEKLSATRITDIALSPTVRLTFSKSVAANFLTSDYFQITGSTSTPVSVTGSVDNTVVTITPLQPLKDLMLHQVWVSPAIRGTNQEVPSTFVKYFYTTVDPNPKFPTITDDELLTLVQRQAFKYFWDFGHPASGMARERNTSGDVVTTGGSGFGIMALVVGIDRGFITRQEGIDRMVKIVSFLETTDRFHGAWSHWINGNTGKVIPFSTKDDGGDLVETSFLVQGLLTFRQYLDNAVPQESDLIDRITALWEGVEWDWYRRGGQNVLYWHWSPNYQWDMNFALSGYFEEQITYFLAAASPTHGIPKICYTNGFAKNGGIVKNNTYYNIKLPLESPSPLFWVHYSYLGLNPHFTDDYANYWEQNVNATLINRAYCLANPKNYVGYGPDCWGLTASDNQNGYSAHSPGNDLGVISPTAALSSFPYTPTESMQALKFFYYKLGDRLWGTYGFYDAFNLTQGWVADSYLAIDQGPIIVMIENHRTGLLWDLFMSAPEVQTGMTTLNFTPN